MKFTNGLSTNTRSMLKTFTKMFDKVLWQVSKISRARLWYAATKMDLKKVAALYVLIGTTLCMITVGAASSITSWTLIFPGLGPTAMLIFYAPQSVMASPRNALLSHLISAAVGLICFLTASFLLDGHLKLNPPGLALISAMTIALGISGLLMVLFDLLHPPAASTTLVGAMGMFTHWYDLPVMMTALTLLCGQGYLIHKIAGVKYPLWKSGNHEALFQIDTDLGVLTNRPFEDGASPYEKVARSLIMRKRPNGLSGS